MSHIDQHVSESFAMEGEDIILRSLLRKRIDQGTYFDIGSSEPVKNSNTYLLYRRGWRGVAVDGRNLTAQWRVLRPGDHFEHCLLGERTGKLVFWTFPDATMNTADSITAERYAERFSDSDVNKIHITVRRAYDLWREAYRKIFQSHSSCAPLEPPAPDVVSIDVEGFEMPVLRGLLEPSPQWRPGVLVVETKLFHFLEPLENEIVHYLIKNHSYNLISKTPLNAFFIDPLNPLFDWLPRSMLKNE
jgi:hypothetical protein